MSAFCLECNAPIDEEKELAEGRQPCPQCGSLKRMYEETLISSITIGTSLVLTRMFHKLS
jgi:DNA-directed RNA polymerase subunit RPC12/RpoP